MSVLKWLTLSLFAYVGVVLVVQTPWAQVGPGTSSSRRFSSTLPILRWSWRSWGTTISPYLFFWQAEEEVEETHERKGAIPLGRAPRARPGRAASHPYRHLYRHGLLEPGALSILLATATTLHARGVTDIQTSSQAAEALLPIAGHFAFLIFALGIIGTGMLALPVLAGSAAFATGETLGWHVGLARKPRRAKAFYG